MGDVDFFQLLYSVDWHQNYDWHNKTCLKLYLFWLFCVQCLCQSWQLEKHASHFGKKCYFQFSKMQNSQTYQNNQNEHCKNNFWFDPTPNMPPYLYFYLSTERGIKRGKCYFYFSQNIQFWMPASFVRQLLTMPASDVRLRHFPMFDNNEPFVPFWWLWRKVAMGKHSSEEVLLAC